MHLQAAPSPTVCLFSSNPITISECQGVLYLANYTLRIKRTDDGNGEFPVADIYAVEARAAAEATQSMVGQILSRDPRARVLIIGDNFDETNAFPLLTMGVKGIVRQAEIRADLARALAAVHQDGFWVPRQLLSKFVGSVLSSTRRMLYALGSAELTESQAKLLQCLMSTESDTEIARTLGISEPEVKSEVSQLMKKFNVRRRWDLVLLAHQGSSPRGFSRSA
jgi:DNA-binding NarL/FixJ family response regulator